MDYTKNTPNLKTFQTSNLQETKYSMCTEFHPDTEKSVICPICGIGAFAHRHKQGTLPKDFERIEDTPEET